MSRRHARTRPRRLAGLRLPSTTLVAAVVTAVVVSGCSSSGSSTTTEAVGASGRSGGTSAPQRSEDPIGVAVDPGTDILSSGLPEPSGADGSTAGAPDGPDASDRPDPGLAGSPVPTRPPGDGAPGEDGGPARRGGVTDPDHPAVADSAAIDSESVGGIMGGSWTVAPDGQATGSNPPGPGCALPENPGATARSTRTLTAAGGASIVERLAVYRTAAAATTSLTPTVQALRACGFHAAADPRLGDASAHLESTGTGANPSRRAVLVAAEGVTVVLLLTDAATGPQPAASGSWESLADLALGSSCSAAVDGCH